MKINFVYFAWVRERIGLDGETRELNSAVTISDALETLRSIGPGYQSALGELHRLRFALDQDFVDVDAKLRDGAELAIFPPVTGG